MEAKHGNSVRRKQAHEQCYSPCTSGDGECDLCCVRTSDIYFGKCISSKCHCLVKTEII
ncbi:PREDICTED: defensin-like protein 113 [Camelina sativa]|uniref:Defensin-like protein 113 n=1 Tax=Camelina sativa TaxID=90675 RepID=A0ABM1QBY1_CAMSA|nr:PREDICTED: defensin-like protein 113 [Camelina sativa]